MPLHACMQTRGEKRTSEGVPKVEGQRSAPIPLGLVAPQDVEMVHADLQGSASIVLPQKPWDAEASLAEWLNEPADAQALDVPFLGFRLPGRCIIGFYSCHAIPSAKWSSFCAQFHEWAGCCGRGCLAS